MPRELWRFDCVILSCITDFSQASALQCCQLCNAVSSAINSFVDTCASLISDLARLLLHLILYPEEVRPLVPFTFYLYADYQLQFRGLWQSRSGPSALKDRYISPIFSKSLIFAHLPHASDSPMLPSVSPHAGYDICADMNLQCNH